MPVMEERTLESGTQLGPYEIGDLLGAGGMGEVYQARDQRLRRDVALKVLKPESAKDDLRLRRFFEEARSAGSLNHPNVLAIYDVDSEAKPPYLVSELLKGRTLRQILDNGPMAMRLLVKVAAQLAQGLAAAHEKGFVHRDLKPENVFVTRDERVKILDFGLAKLVESPLPPELTKPGEAAGGMPKTEPGTLLGTVSYMSPEQVEGNEPDQRSDIFAFGSVLYEMISGHRAFEEATPFATLHAVLMLEPPEVPETPRELTRIVERCLAKLPENRFQSAHDLAFQLESLAENGLQSTTGVVPQGPAPKSSSALPRLMLGALLVFAAGLVAGGLFWPESPAEPEHVPPARLEAITHSGEDRLGSASPDGRTVAFVSGRDGSDRIWLKQLPSGGEAVLTTGLVPRFTPDGGTIIFNDQGDLYRIPVLGGERKLIANDVLEADVSPDGRTVAFVRSGPFESALGLVALDGSGERILFKEALGLGSPRFSPSGRFVSVSRSSSTTMGRAIAIIDIESGDIRTVGGSPEGSSPNTSIWGANDDEIIYSQSLSGYTFVPGHEVVWRDLQTGREEKLLFLLSPVIDLDAIRDGQLVLSTNDVTGRLYEMDLTSGEGRWITGGTSIDRQPTFTPDGRSILFMSTRAGSADVWKMELETGEVRRLTDSPRIDWDPTLMPDGSLLWSSNRGGHFEIWKAAPDGRNPQQLSNDGFDAENPAFEPQRQWVLYASSNPDKGGIWRMGADGSDPQRLVRGTTGIPQVSPDGIHFLFLRPTPGQATIRVARLQDAVELRFSIPCRVPAEIAQYIVPARPRWISGGREIAFACADDQGSLAIYAQEFSLVGDTSHTRRLLASFDLESFGVPDTFALSPDGQRLVVSLWRTTKQLVLATDVPRVVGRRVAG